VDTILITDDNPYNVQVLIGILGEEKYRFLIALGGDEALFIAHTAMPDLILLDILMPKMDGFEVCQRLKDNMATRHIPVIFMTAFQREKEFIVKGFEVGAADYILKPFHAAELIARVQTHLELKRHRDHLEAMVRQRTAELQEKSTALKVMLETREEISTNIQEKITANIHHQIFPMLEKLREPQSLPVQKRWVSMIQTRLMEMLSQFPQRLSSFTLTPAEIQIATLIKEGKSGKQIAGLLNVAEGTVNFHRNNIRKKLGLIHHSDSLKTYLKQLR
jgi:DNA-binding response OmpR family regulator/DNA-binding CsgD family transcriptional regulator